MFAWALQPLDEYAGELITYETSFPGTSLAAPPTILVARLSASLRMANAAGREAFAAREMQSAGAAVNRTINIPLAQLEKKFASHAADFGVTLPRGRDGFDALKSAIECHVANPSTMAIPGTLRWTEEVTQFFNPNTGLLVIRDGEDIFRSGWKLDADQIRRLTESGNVW